MADDKIEELLISWGFPDLVNIFREHEIDSNNFLDLNDNLLKEIIPKLGPRAKFIRLLGTYHTLNKMDVIIDPNIDISLIDVPDVLNCTSPSTSSSTFESTSNNFPLNEDELSAAYKKATSKLRKFYGEDEMQQAFTRKIFHINLKTFLELTTAGRHVLLEYNKNNNKMTRKTRNILVDLIINGVMSTTDGDNLKNEDFKILARKIVELFQSEDEETYYIPRVSGVGNPQKKAINPKGKLVDKYRNLKHLYKCGSSKVDTSDNQPGDSITDDVLECAEWLKIWNTPWEVVSEKWQKTFNMRRENNSSTVNNFLDEWPVLKGSDAPKLIKFDFKYLFPSCELNLLHDFKIWEDFFEKIKSQNENTFVDIGSAELLKKLDLNISQDSRNAIQFACLPVLFPPKSLIRYKKKIYWKPSIVECQESLINLVKHPGDIEIFASNRKKKVASYDINIQPYIIVVGASYESITDFYLVIEDTFHKCETVLGTIDLAFKTFHALHAEYPKESEHIWLLIQKLVYNINTPWDKKIPYVNTLVHALE